MRAGRRLAVNGVLMSGSSGVSGVVLLVVFVIAARYLGVEGLGNFVLILTVTSLVQLFGDGGIVNITTRDMARDLAREGEILAKSSGLVWAVSGPLVVVLVVAAGLLAHTSELRVVIYLMGAAALSALHGSLLAAVARAHEEMGVVALLGVLHKIVLVILVFAVTRWDLGLQGIAGAHLAANLAHWVALHLFVRLRYVRPRVALDARHARYLLRESLPLGAGVLLRRINIHICTLLLGVLVGTGAVGIYNAGYRFLQMAEIGSLTFSSVLLPALAKAYGPDLVRFNRLYSSSTRALLLVSAPVAGLLVVAGNDVVVAVYGAAYAPAGVVLQLLGLSLVALVPGALLHAAFTAARRQPVFMRLSALGVAVNASACLVLIPMTQSLGAAVSTLLTEFVTLLVGAHWLSRSGIRARYLDTLLRALAPTTMAALGVMALRLGLFADASSSTALLLSIVSYVAFYAAFVVVLRVVRVDELTRLLKRSPETQVRMEEA